MGRENFLIRHPGGGATFGNRPKYSPTPTWVGTRATSCRTRKRTEKTQGKNILGGPVPSPWRERVCRPLAARVDLAQHEASLGIMEEKAQGLLPFRFANFSRQ